MAVATSPCGRAIGLQVSRCVSNGDELGNSSACSGQGQSSASQPGGAQSASARDHDPAREWWHHAGKGLQKVPSSSINRERQSRQQNHMPRKTDGKAGQRTCAGTRRRSEERFFFQAVGVCCSSIRIGRYLASI